MTNSTEKKNLQATDFYTTLKLLRNPRKQRVFEILVNKKRITTRDVSLLVDDSLSYVGDRLREFEKVGLATNKGESAPLVTDVKTPVPIRYSGEYLCYEATDHAELIHRFLAALNSDEPLANLPNLIKPEDIVRDCIQLERSEFLKVLEKFKVMHNLSALLVCLYYASPNRSADCNVLSSFLSNRLDPEEIYQILGGFSGNNNLVISRYVSLKAADKLKRRVSELLRAWAPSRWSKQNRTTYSLTTEGKHIAGKLIDKFKPRDLGINEQKLRASGIYEYKGIKKTLLSDLFSLLLVVLLGLPIAIIAWIVIMAIFVWNIIKDIGKWRVIRK